MKHGITFTREKHIVKIRCPQCGAVIDGEIEIYENFPFAGYGATCPHCEYEITESEFEEK
jgi:Zn ribbon nucleic-acid-binding protein